MYKVHFYNIIFFLIKWILLPSRATSYIKKTAN